MRTPPEHTNMKTTTLGSVQTSSDKKVNLLCFSNKQWFEYALTPPSDQDGWNVVSNGELVIKFVRGPCGFYGNIELNKRTNQVRSGQWVHFRGLVKFVWAAAYRRITEEQDLWDKNEMSLEARDE